MEQFVSQDPRSYSLYFDLKIWFRARKVTGTFEKRAPAHKKDKYNVFTRLAVWTVYGVSSSFRCKM